jgi:hypothetical protein
VRPGAGWNRKVGAEAPMAGRCAAGSPPLSLDGPSFNGWGARQVLGQRHALLGRQRRALGFHHAAGQRLDDETRRLARIDERVGARVVGIAWQAAQCCSNEASCTLSSGACDSAALIRGAKPMTAAARSKSGVRPFPLTMRRKVDHRQTGCQLAPAYRVMSSSALRIDALGTPNRPP